jgi:sodium/hydrogen antiporter
MGFDTHMIAGAVPALRPAQPTQPNITNRSNPHYDETLGPALGELDWRVALYAVGSLTVVRMLPVALAMLGTGMRRVTVGFLGWFGPRGLASIVFVLILVEQTELPERSLMLTVVTWTVALSVYAHGLSAWPGANRYADWYAAHRRDHGSMPESVPATEQRVRVPALPRQGEGPT